MIPTLANSRNARGPDFPGRARFEPPSIMQCFVVSRVIGQTSDIPLALTVENDLQPNLHCAIQLRSSFFVALASTAAKMYTSCNVG